MRAAALRLARVPVVVGVVAAILIVGVPFAMSQYAPYPVRPGITCVRVGPLVSGTLPFPPGMCLPLASLYRRPFIDLFVESTFRSLALLVGAAVLALVLGTLLGTMAGLWRRRVWAAGTVIGVTTLLTAVPAFFVAYFLQIAVIVIGATPQGGSLLPVLGFGYDKHLVLPLLSISVPAVAYTAQLTATRMTEVLNADFITAARAKGLPTLWILRVHVLPHVRPVIFEALGSGLRVSVASLPIIEYLFLWRGIGQLALEAVGVHDAAGLIFAAVALVTFFATLSAVADISRPRTLYRAA
ncbi:MAG: ABC transporter permease [Chloroflexi bacterium]|nr:MAG: ABC transporter permease [Chloroflexota bacterium]